MSEHKVFLEVDTYFIMGLASIAGVEEKTILYRFNDEAIELCRKLRDPKFKSNWSSKTFNIDKTPFKLKIKAKFTAYRGRREGNIICTFDVQNGRGRKVKHDSDELFNEMVESTIFKA